MKKIIWILGLSCLVQMVCAQSFQEWMERAQNGDSFAMDQVGVKYIRGEGVKKDVVEAVRWFQQSANLGNPLGQYDLAVFLYYGEGITQNSELAFMWALKSAKQGFSIAQCLVGDLYKAGDGVDKDEKEAFNWYMRAAQFEPKISTACMKLAECYHMGIGVEVNMQEAFKWCMEAAELGDVHAQITISDYYANGLGILQDYVAAFKWALKAAEAGFLPAQSRVTYCYREGIGVEKNDFESFKWGMKMAEQGDAVAQHNIAYYYANGIGCQQSYVRAIEWYRKAMAQNYAFSFNNMAYLYMAGNGVPKDVNKAFEMVDKAIELEPDKVNYYDTKGELYSMLGDEKKALEVWDKILSLDPNFKENDTPFVKYILALQGNDIDMNIPSVDYKSESTFAVIIANEKYQREVEVPYALNDGQIFAKYCQQTLGIPERNIHLVENATLNDMKYHINWLKQVIDVYGEDSKVIFYYAGHGIPDEATQTACLLPVDGYGSEVSTGYPLKTLYGTLGAFPSKSVMVFLDACFSGTKRDGDMMASARGVAIRVKEDKPMGNLVVFSASQGDETAYPYDDKSHGMFTYFLLKKLQETKGELSIGELGSYVTDQVRKQSIVCNGKLQTPTLLPAAQLGDGWKEWKLR